MSTVRKHYNPIYMLWEIQREQPSEVVEGHSIWKTLSCRESEAEADAEIERLSSD
jgi:hypothetical protein